MGDSPDDPRQELAGILDETRRHLQWMQDAGVQRVRRESAGRAVAAPSAPVRTRPSFAQNEAPVPKQAPAPLMPPKPPAPLPSDPVLALKQIREEIGDCQRCPLGKTRTKLVYGQGNPKAEVLFLGEAPGEDEDLSGLAFVGKAGQLLTKMIEAMGFTRDDVYICNINKCRPPGNRKPLPVEVEACRPFVEQQIRAIKPKVIVALGATATHSLLRVETPISRLRNNWTDWEGVPVMPTFHPSFLLRSPWEKPKAWDDLKMVLAKLGREVPKRGA